MDPTKFFDWFVTKPSPPAKHLRVPPANVDIPKFVDCVDKRYKRLVGTCGGAPPAGDVRDAPTLLERKL